MLHNPITPSAWPYLQPQSHSASPASRARHVARWHPYESANGLGIADKDGERSSPGPKRRLHITIPGKCVMCESFPESAQLPGARPPYVRQYSIPPASIQTPSTVKPLRSILTTPSSGGVTPVRTPLTAHPSRLMSTPASALSPISPIRERAFFGQPMTHGHPAFGEVAAGARLSGHGMDEDDARTEIGSPEFEADDDGSGGGGAGSVRLPPLRQLPNPVMSGSIAQQTRRAMHAGSVSQDVLLYGPAGVTPAPAELARNNICDKLPPIPALAPPRQATFFGIQNVPVADGSTRFATICAPVRPPSARPVYPPAGLAPLVAGHQGLPHGGLTAPIERGEEVADWKECQRAKERADIVVKDGELTVAERAEMEKRVFDYALPDLWLTGLDRVGLRARRQMHMLAERVAMSVKVINHIYYGAEDVPKTRSPTHATRRLADEDSFAGDAGPSTVASLHASATREAYWPPTPASMPASPESPRKRRERQRASMRKEILGETVRSSIKREHEPLKDAQLEEMVRSIGSSGARPEEPEDVDSNREQPARTLTWFVTEVLRRSRTSINVLQVALAYLAGAKPEIHKELRLAADRQAELSMQIAGLPQHIRDALPGMDWMGSEFTPSPLIDPRRTFLASLVLASKFLLDKAFSNKAWAKLSGLEALEVGKCERALGSALNWRLWVGREVSRECVASTSYEQPPAQPPMLHTPPSCALMVAPIDSPIQASSPRSVGTGSRGSVFTASSTPTLVSELGSEPEMLQGYEEVGKWTQTPEFMADIAEPMVASGEMLHGSPDVGYSSRAAASVSMHSASDVVASSRPVLPSIRSFDRPPLRRGPSDLVTPQTDSNMGCGHVPSICVEFGRESPLAYASLDRPWEAIHGQRWDFDTDGIIT